MALVFADRVREVAATTGTGTWTLGGAVTGYQTFLAGIGDGNTTYYTAWDGGAGWEVGLGTYAASGNTLARTTVLASSNAGSLVNFTTAPTVWFETPAGVLFSMLPGGTDTQIQYNDGGVLAGSAAMTFDKSTGVATFAPAAPDLNGGFILNFSGVAASSLPEVTHVSSLRIVGRYQDIASVFIDGFSARAVIVGEMAGGTPASPSATAAGDELFRVGGRGYFTSGGAAYTPTTTAVSFIAGELQTSTAQGGWIGFRTTVLGTRGGGSSSIPPVVAAITPNGGLVVGATGLCSHSGGPDVTTLNRDPGAGYIQALSGVMLTGTTLADTITLKAPAFTGTAVITLPAGTTDFSATGGASNVVMQTTAGGAFSVAQLKQSDILGQGASKLYPTTDSTTAIQITKADGTTPILNVDTTDKYVGIGTTAPSAFLEIYSTFAGTAMVMTADGVVSNLVLRRYQSTSPGFTVNFRKAGGSHASPAPVSSGDQIGANLFSALDTSTTAYRNVCSVEGFVDTLTGTNDISGYIALKTRPNGSGAALAEVMRLTKSGGASVGDATFNATDPGAGVLAVQNGLSVAGAAVTLASLATSDPHVAGRLWNNSGVVNVSAG